MLRPGVSRRNSNTWPPKKEELQAGGFEIVRSDFLFIFPGALRWLRGLESLLSNIPLGAQYLVLGRKL